MFDQKKAASNRIILVDDDQNIHDAVSILLKAVDDIRLVGQAHTGEEAIQLCKVARPDLVLMDVVMPRMNGAQTTKALMELFPDLKILVLSSVHDYADIKAMLDAGAIGYLVKDAIFEDLINTIRNSLQGNTVFSPEVARVILTPPKDEAVSDFGLTERERQVLKLIAAGHTDNQVALMLNISQPTVRFHFNNILAKFKVFTRSEVLVLAVKNHLI